MLEKKFNIQINGKAYRIKISRHAAKALLRQLVNNQDPILLASTASHFKIFDKSAIDTYPEIIRKSALQKKAFVQFFVKLISFGPKLRHFITKLYLEIQNFTLQFRIFLQYLAYKRLNRQKIGSESTIGIPGPEGRYKIIYLFGRGHGISLLKQQIEIFERLARMKYHL